MLLLLSDRLLLGPGAALARLSLNPLPVEALHFLPGFDVSTAAAHCSSGTATDVDRKQQVRVDISFSWAIQSHVCCVWLFINVCDVYG